MVRCGPTGAPSTSTFIFDCPNCRGRLTITAAQRNLLLHCTHCNLQFPAPDFRRSWLDAPAPRPLLRYPCRCRHCNAVNDAVDADAGLPLRCDGCHEWFPQPAAPWERWRRAVARVFTRADQRRSLHHLMFAGARLAWHDDDIELRALRRFEHYCGGCGRLRQARVWDIASQQRCPECRALFIVPCPPHSPVAERVERLTLWDAAAPLGLYCPVCGLAAPDGDATRARRSFCRRCAAWF